MAALAFALAPPFAAPRPAAAQQAPAAPFPSRPVQLLIGFPAGGGADLIALAMRADEVQIFADALNIATQLELRPIAVFRAEPLAMAPELLLVRSVGYDFEFSIQGGIFVPRATPEVVVQRWEDACRATVRAPEALAALERTRVLPNFKPGAEYADFMRREHETVGAIVRAVGIQKQD